MARALTLLIVLAAVAFAVLWFGFPQHLPEGWRARPAVGAAKAPERSGGRDNPPLYKWRDDVGVWNITDRPPPDRPYERVVVDPEQNVVPTVVPPWAQPAPAASPGAPPPR